MTTYRTLDQAKLKGKHVMMRAGFDVPMEDGNVSDTTRIEAVEKTMRYILDQGAVLILLAHQGRPKDKPDPAFSQKPLVPILEKLLKTTVHFAADCVGPAAEKAVKAAKPGEVVLLENLRFHPEEKKNDEVFAKALSKLGNIYVNDAFTNCHRVHASMVALPAIVPAFMGFNLAEEVKYLSMVLRDPPRPLTLIVSGAKMETKVPVMERFLKKGDNILVGGCIANTLIAARGFDVGTSKYDESGLELAQNLMLASEGDGAAKIIIPRDVVVASALDEKAAKLDLPVENVVGDMSIFDIGTVTVKRYCDMIAASKMIVWNGPLGVYEYNRFSHATKRIAEAIALATKNGAVSLVGGGDTIDFHLKYKYPLSAYTFVSMGGGAMLEFVAGKKFASLKVLEK
ncbi:MAG: phosphoglycerate kinase [Candidatus Peribacteraceae bacterium]|nr:phosphoglycerate kinase [Candidatus Peribacteraceae bacterium]